MKTYKLNPTNLCLSILFASLMACQTPAPKHEKTDEPIDVAEIKKPVQQSESNCQKDAQISAGAAEIITETYASTLRAWPSFNGDSSLIRSFEPSKVETLLNQCSDCNGVRIYFGYSSESEIPTSPQLLMVNTNDCNAYLDDEQAVLVSSNSDGVSTFMSAADAASLTENWRNGISSNWGNSSTGWVYDTTYAYTFKRGLFEESTSTEAINFNFTMRVSETNLSASGTSPQIGAFRIGLILNENQGVEGSSAIPIDIAVRCPVTCGENNVLLPS